MSDLISRQSVINAIANTCFWLSADDWNELIECINSIPSAKDKGEWICYTDEFYQQGRFAGTHHRIKECSLCHHKIADFVGNMNFCPNCGTDMRKPTKGD